MEFSESEGEDFGEIPESKVTKQSDIARAIPKNTDEEKSQLELAIQAGLQAKKQNFVDRAEDIVTDPAQMARPMSMFPYNYFNSHLEYYRPPFVFSGPYAGMNMRGHDSVCSYGYGQYAQPATSTITNISADLSAVDSACDKSGTVSAVANDSTPRTDLEQSSNMGPNDEFAAMTLLTLKKP